MLYLSYVDHGKGRLVGRCWPSGPPLPSPPPTPNLALKICLLSFVYFVILYFDKIVAVTQEINSTLQRRRMQCQPAAEAVWLMDSVMEIEVHESDVYVS